MNEKNSGSLYVVATPIGNLEDMTIRAVNILKQVDRIAAEDTRHSSGLLNHFSIVTPTVSFHEHNEREKYKEIIECLRLGENVALISDGGTPLISDPGYRLVHAAYEHGIKVIPIPGASALIAALSASGLPSDHFTFEGFLPAKMEAKANEVNKLLHEKRTMIFYEAPHRLLDTLIVFAKVFGPTRRAVVARELTKIYETILNGTITDLLEHFNNHADEVRGEVVILVSGEVEKEVMTREVIPEKVLDILLEELPLKQAANLASKITGERKNELYALALQKKG